MPLSEARSAVEHPNGPGVWAALLDEFAAELQALEIRHAVSDLETARQLDDIGVPWVPRLGGRAPLGADLEDTARFGRWDRSRYAGRSEARMAILGAAVARGWRLAEVESAIASGAWKGLAALYERRSEPGRLDRLLPYEETGTTKPCRAASPAKCLRRALSLRRRGKCAVTGRRHSCLGGLAWGVLE
jgi:hypothetical protein